MVATSGGILVDKPSGMTSQQVCSRLKRHSNLSKVGHAGTLDPLATGLLLVLVGRATRLQSFFLCESKAYEGTILLGRSTTTDDCEGETLEEWSEEGLREVSAAIDALLPGLVNEFIGEIAQVPPQVSAVRVNGKRSYARVRAGETVEHCARRVHIHAFELVRVSERQLRYSVRCSKGTYVRSLARDIGKALGVPACVETLRRTESGGLRVEDAVPLETLLAGSELELRSPAELLNLSDSLPCCAETVLKLRAGDQRVFEHISCEQFEGSLVGLLDASSELFALAEKHENRLKLRCFL